MTGLTVTSFLVTSQLSEYAYCFSSLVMDVMEQQKTGRHPSFLWLFSQVQCGSQLIEPAAIHAEIGISKARFRSR